ncbi:MAG TPA: TIGR02253 family HAD-type hydrolase [Candidatus Nanoarchaeia archaeon]|nr:TIGR02253 family HAD-type hydrolase [Candidatus Nanoarchaeia archaeon]
MIKAVLFDLDNTLIDFMKMKRMSCEAAISSMIDAGLKMEKEKAMEELFKLYNQYGLEDPMIFQRFLKLYGRVDSRIIANGIVAYRKVRLGFLDSYPHVRKTLMELKLRKIKTGIVTDAPRLKAWIRLASMKIDDLFDAVVAFEDTKQRKPSELPFREAIKKLGVEPENCLMIGDWPERDINGAKKLGIKTCFARYGNPSVKKSGADYEINSIEEILSIL